MKKKVFVFALLALSASIVHAQINILGGEGEDGPRLVLSGEFLGMYTLGFASDDQRISLPVDGPAMGLEPAGIFDADSGRNGFMTRMDFGIRFLPVPWIDLYVQFRARSRPGNPYIPLQLEAAGADEFGLSFEQAWARINVIDGLGLDVPFDLWVRGGMFDTAPASFQRVTRFGTENVMSRLRTKNLPSVQLEGIFQTPFAESVSVIAATQQRFNESIVVLYDVDGGLGWHGLPAHGESGVLPLFTALQFRGIATPIGSLYAEAVYVLNAEDIFSGHNFGADGRLDIRLPDIDNITIPFGLGIAITEKNIDPMARAAHGLGNNNALFDISHHFPPGVGSQAHNTSTVSFRRSLRLGVGLGLRVENVIPGLDTEFNLGYSYSQIAHIYRETLTLNSMSIDMRVTFDSRFFLGGGIFLGTLGDAEWRTAADTDPAREPGFSHVFTLAENMGFEVHAGLNMGRSRLVFGYNMNRGLSMGHGIEAMSDAQLVFLQRGTSFEDGLFETGGFFTKLVISW